MYVIFSILYKYFIIKGVSPVATNRVCVTTEATRG